MLVMRERREGEREKETESTVALPRCGGKNVDIKLLLFHDIPLSGGEGKVMRQG